MNLRTKALHAMKIAAVTVLGSAVPISISLAHSDEPDSTAGLASYPTPVINGKTKLCLAATGGELSVVVQKPCSGDTELLWRTELVGPAGNGYFYFRLKSAQNSLCADLQTYSDADNVAIALRPCSGEPSQHWRGVPVGNQFQFARVTNRATKKCLDAQVNGPNISQWKCGSRDNQRWLVNF